MAKIAEVAVTAPTGVTPAGRFPLEVTIPVPDGTSYDTDLTLQAGLQSDSSQLRFGQITEWMHSYDGSAVECYRAVFMLEASDVGEVLEITDKQVQPEQAGEEEGVTVAESEFTFEPHPDLSFGGNSDIAFVVRVTDHRDRLYQTVIDLTPTVGVDGTTLIEGGCKKLTWKTTSRLEKVMPFDEEAGPSSDNMGQLIAYFSVWSGSPMIGLDLVWTNGEAYATPGDTYFKKIELATLTGYTITHRGYTPFDSDFTMTTVPGTAGLYQAVELVSPSAPGDSNEGRCHSMLAMRANSWRMLVAKSTVNAEDRSFMEKNHNYRVLTPSTTLYSWCNANTARYHPNQIQLGIYSDATAQADVDAQIAAVLSARETGTYANIRWMGQGMASTVGSFKFGPYCLHEASDAGYPSGNNIHPLPYAEVGSYAPEGFASALFAIQNSWLHSFSYMATDVNGNPMLWLAQPDTFGNIPGGPIYGGGTSVTCKFISESGSGNYDPITGQPTSRTCFRQDSDKWRYRYAFEESIDQLRADVVNAGLFPTYMGGAGIEGFSSPIASHQIRSWRGFYAQAVFLGDPISRELCLSHASDIHGFWNTEGGFKGAWPESLAEQVIPGYGAVSLGRQGAWSLMSVLFAKKFYRGTYFDNMIEVFTDAWVTGQLSSGVWYVDAYSSENQDQPPYGDFTNYAITQGYQHSFVEFALDSYTQFSGSTKVTTAQGGATGKAACVTAQTLHWPSDQTFSHYKWCNYPLPHQAPTSSTTCGSPRARTRPS
jgi:hypothetical protein